MYEPALRCRWQAINTPLPAVTPLLVDQRHQCPRKRLSGRDGKKRGAKRFANGGLGKGTGMISAPLLKARVRDGKVFGRKWIFGGRTA